MLDDKKFWAGVGAGVFAVYAFHRFIKPIPNGKSS